MTATEPGRRPDAREVAARLGRPAVVGRPGPVDEEPRRSRAPWIVLAVVALLVVVGVFALTRGGEETDPTAAPATTTEATAEPTPEPTTEPEAEPTEPDVALPEIPSELPDLPSLPSDLPDIPSELPDLPTIPPDVQDGARNAWEQFTDWLSGVFGGAPATQ